MPNKSIFPNFLLASLLKTNLQKLGDGICLNTDRRLEGSNQNNSSTSVTSWRDISTFPQSLQLNSAQSMSFGCTSINMSRALNQTTPVTQEARGNMLNSLKASFEHHSLLGNKSKCTPSYISSNLGPPVTSSTTA